TADNRWHIALSQITNIINPQILTTYQQFTPVLATINTTQNNYALTALTAILSLNVTAAVDLTGLTGGFDGRFLTMINRGTSTLTLKDEAAASRAENRIKNPGAVDLTLKTGESMGFFYSGTDSRWIPTTAAPSNSPGSPTVTEYTGTTTSAFVVVFDLVKTSG